MKELPIYKGIHFGLYKDFRQYKCYLVGDKEVDIPIESKLTIDDYLKSKEEGK